MCVLLLCSSRVVAARLVFGWRILCYQQLFFFSLCGSLWSFQVVHPKSDQQRHRLAEAVKNIFIFRSLDPVRQKPLLIILVIIEKSKEQHHTQVCAPCPSSVTTFNHHDGQRGEGKSCVVYHRRVPTRLTVLERVPRVLFDIKASD
jgi:hypothetical protein